MRVLSLLVGATALIAGVISADVSAQTAKPAASKPSVVYHFDDASVQAIRGLRALRNQLDSSPDTTIAVVAHAEGVEMFMTDARDPKSGTEYAPLISDLKSRGVQMYVCELTLALRDLNKDAFILEADFTRSGVAKITELQQVNGYAYIKP
jgi:intracellular sulfur oxidation DsrE/DsrF family protein